jgi:hypothetical protein
MRVVMYTKSGKLSADVDLNVADVDPTMVVS